MLLSSAVKTEQSVSLFAYARVAAPGRPPRRGAGATDRCERSGTSHRVGRARSGQHVGGGRLGRTSCPGARGRCEAALAVRAAAYSRKARAERRPRRTAHRRDLPPAWPHGEANRLVTRRFGFCWHAGVHTWAMQQAATYHSCLLVVVSDSLGARLGLWPLGSSN